MPGGAGVDERLLVLELLGDQQRGAGRRYEQREGDPSERSPGRPAPVVTTGSWHRA
jgi:hypothetical protein